MEQTIEAVGPSKALRPIELYRSPVSKPLSNASSTSSRPAAGMAKRKRATRACDVCRFNHRKCPGPAPGSDACIRCIKQHKTCTRYAQHPRVSSPASASTSPKTPKPRKISIRLLKSLPSPQQLNPTHGLPLLDDSSPSSSSALLSNEEDQGPATPEEAPPVLPLKAQKIAEPAQASESFILQLPAAFQEIPQQQPEAAEVLPEWYADCLELANKRDLLLFAMPLEIWEERQLRRDGHSRSVTGLGCIVPSWIDPLPTREEAVEMLVHLMLNMRVFPSAYADSRSSINSVSYAQREVQAATSLDEEPWGCSAPSETSLNNDIVLSLSAPRPSSTPANDQSIGMIVDDIDSASETEPCSSTDLTLDTSNSSRLESMSPYRHRAGRDQFDTFLYSPCHCSTIPPTRLATSPRLSADESSLDIQVKDERMTWDVGMPDVLTDASLDTSVEDYLCIEQVVLLD